MRDKLARILVVDDAKEWRIAIGSMLEARPTWEIVSEAGDGREGVRKATLLQPDLVLLDIALPTLNGIKAARLIRERCPRTRVVFVTQNIDSEVKNAAMSTGAAGYVLKVNAAHELLDVISTSLTLQ